MLLQTTMQITFDLDNPIDRDRVRKLLDDADRRAVSRPAVSIEHASDNELEPRIRELLEGYGPTRRVLARLVAEASPNTISKDEIYEAMAKIEPKRDQSQAVGGAHSSLERSWKRVGGPGKFFETTSSGFTMRRDIARLVRKVLDEWEAANPDANDESEDD